MAEGSYNQFCPVAMAAEILCTRWTMVLLRELVAGSARFNELRRGVPRMSPALLSKRLKDLEAAGIIARSPLPGDPDLYEYRLTGAGRELRRVVEAVGEWGQRWVSTEASLGNRRQPADVGHAAQYRHQADAGAPQPHPGDLFRSAGSPAQLVAARRPYGGRRSMLG
jgi:DNA-binding HxlR family transcriptional regulator